MEPYGFIDPRDIRYHKTVQAIKNALLYKGLMYRYKSHDDFGLPSSAFTICTFWLIRALYVIGEKEEARSLFEEITWDFSVKTLILKPRSNWGIFLKHIPIWH